MLPGISGADLSGKTATFPLIEMGLLIFSAALFSLSFPSELALEGIPVLAWFCLIPALYVVNSTPWRRLFLYGPLWGALSYGLFNYWLGTYHPLGLVLGMTVHALWYLMIVFLLRLARHLFPVHGFWLQVGIWMSYEYLRIQGFLAFPYGNLAYSQFGVDWLRMSAGLWGIWGAGLILLLPGINLAWFFSTFQAGGKSTPAFRLGLSAGSRRLLLPGLVWLCLVVTAVVYSTLETDPGPVLREVPMILVQQNMDPLIGGLEAYRESLVRLMRQTRAGLEAHPDTVLVVWAETSFIPAIEWHDRFRKDPEKYALVRQLQEFSLGLGRPLVLGNGEGVPYTDGSGEIRRKDYNAVLVMENGKVTRHYRKNRLIPFTEYFPFKGQLPWIYALLEKNGSSFWVPGEGFNVLEAGGLKFGTPICYEDSFPDISRNFAQNGAQILVNLSNDSWSKSVPAAMQHLAMATFRASENRMSMVRSTNGGMSALIDPSGRIMALNKPFTESWLYVKAAVYNTQGMVPAGLAGDLPGLAILVLTGLSLLAGLVRRVSSRRAGSINR